MAAPTYTEEQLDQYFHRIGYPRTEEWQSKDPLALLTEIQSHHLGKVPFEDVSLHYSRERLLSLDPDDLFEKIVVRKRGGYCMEMNTLFGIVLRALGYTVIPTGGRVQTQGWDHMVNLVTIAGQRYLVDVGFGINGPLRPIPLDLAGLEWEGIAPQRGKLEYKNLAGRHTDPNQRVWMFSTKENADVDWQDRYHFTEVEFFPEDFEVMNVKTMSTPQSFFVREVIAMRSILAADEGEPEQGKGHEQVGTLTLLGKYLKRRLNGKTEFLVENFASEDERVKALEELFGIVLKPKEKMAIDDLHSQIRG